MNEVGSRTAALRRAEAETRIVRPRRQALFIALGYLLVAGAYIIVSGDIAARLSGSLPHLEEIERIKGILFVVVTSLLLFAFLFALLRRMAESERRLKALREAIVAAERQSAAGIFASSVAHDINNVLMVMGTVSAELRHEAPTAAPDLLDHLDTATGRLQDLVRRLQQASGRGLGEAEEEFDLAATVRDTVSLAGSHRKVRHCRVSLTAPDQLPFRGRQGMVHRMLLNLVLNAADAAGEHGTIGVRLAAEGDEVVLQVDDDGPGVAEAERERIMEPLHTTRPDGSGLGLLSVLNCVDAHGGAIQVGDSELGGARFEVRLARRPAAGDGKGDHGIRSSEGG